MKKNECLFLIFLIVPSLCFTQYAHFIMGGRIEFEKSLNMFAILKKGYDPAIDVVSSDIYEQYRRTQPQFVKQKSTLLFSNTKTLFVPEVNDTRFSWGDKYPLTKQFNTVYTDLSKNISVTQKDVFGDLFLIRDSVRTINWKITDETREIAGYLCRRANAIILDSVYVVAFYTIEIPVAGGPESFSGLPGMILGVVLPHENITWFATSVTDNPALSTSITQPQKGRLINWAELFPVLLDISKRKTIYGLSLTTVFRF